jgi:hypothetical protein
VPPGVIIMTPHHLLLQRRLLFHGKLSLSVLDDGGEANVLVSVTALDSPRRPLETNVKAAAVRY